MTRLWAAPLYRAGLRPGRPCPARPAAPALVRISADFRSASSAQRRDFPAFGATNREPAQPSLTVALEVCERPAVRAASAISLGSTCPPARLRGEHPDDPVVGQRTDRVDERIRQIAVALAPPQQHQIDDVVGVLVEQIVAAPSSTASRTASSTSSSQPSSWTTCPGSTPSLPAMSDARPASSAAATLLPFSPSSISYGRRDRAGCGIRTRDSSEAQPSLRDEHTRGTIGEHARRNSHSTGRPAARSQPPSREIP